MLGEASGEMLIERFESKARRGFVNVQSLRTWYVTWYHISHDI